MQYIKLTTAIAVVLCGISFGQDDKPNVDPQPIPAKDEFWMQGQMPGEHRVMSEERIGQFLGQIREQNPQRADELEALRDQNPEQFRAELLSEFGKRFQQMRQRGGRTDAQPGQPQGPEQPFAPGDLMAGGSHGGAIRERMENAHNQLLAWLEKNDPQQAERLKNLREKNSERYLLQILETMRKYEPILRAEKTNPKLAEVLKEDMELVKKRDKLVEELRFAKDPEQEKLAAELREVTSMRFDIIIAKKQLQYDELKARLDELKKEVEKRATELDKYKADKDKAVDDHVKELIEQSQKMQWD